jgi:cytochrome c
MRLLLAGVLLVLTGCGEAQNEAAQIVGGDVARGRELADERGCGTCHTIPGIRDARGRVGPILRGIGSRAYIAGRLENSPENLVAWIMAPTAIDPQTAMPTLGLDEEEARDIATYLFTLR